MLSQIQWADYRRDGFLVLPSLMPAELMAELNRAYDQAAAAQRVEKQGGAEGVVHLQILTTWHPAFRELALHPALIGLVTQLLGPDVELQQSKLAAKPPAKGRGAFGWHQDLAYFPHTNNDVLAATVFLDDVDEDNGCVKVIRGSHMRGLLDHGDGRGNFTGACEVAGLVRDLGPAVPMVGPVGTVSLHHGLAVHGSEPTISGRPRRLLIYQYRAADAYQLHGRVFEDTGWRVAGSAPKTIRCDAGAMPWWRRDFRTSEQFDTAYHQIGGAARNWNEGRACAAGGGADSPCMSVHKQGQADASAMS